MNIHEVKSYNNNAFNGWARGSADRLLTSAISSAKSTVYIRELVDKIGRISPNHTVSFNNINYCVTRLTRTPESLRSVSDSMSVPPFFKVVRNSDGFEERIVIGKFYNRTVESCLEKIVKFINKDNARLGSISAKTVTKPAIQAEKQVVANIEVPSSESVVQKLQIKDRVSKVGKFLQKWFSLEDLRADRETPKEVVDFLAQVDARKAKQAAKKLPPSILDFKTLEELPVVKTPLKITAAEPPKPSVDEILAHSKARVIHSLKDLH